MSTSFVQAQPSTLGTPVSPVWARLRYGLVAAFLVVGVAIIAFGTRPASFFELARNLQEGTVTQVTVANALLPGSTGTTVAEIRWHDGFLPRYTEVRQVRPGEDGSPDYSGGTMQEITGDIGANLNQYAPRPLNITSIEDWQHTTWTLLGWRVPGWVAITGALAGVATLFLLVSGPQTLMATRWAWFWAFTSVVGFAAMPVFLLWGIPRTGELEQPYTRQGRLTGGWAFILFAIVASSLLPGLRPGG